MVNICILCILLIVESVNMAVGGEDVAQQLAALRLRIQELELADRQADGNNPPQPVRVLYAQRKLGKFNGDPGELEEWIREARASIAAQGLDGQAAAEFLLSYLDGSARREVRYADPQLRADPDGVFDLLQDAFGERLTATQLLNQFCSRNQRERESLQTFSHSLMELLDRALQQDPQCVPNRDHALRDNFAQKVKNKELRRLLTYTIRRNAQATFHEIREEAYKWLEDGGEAPKREVAAHMEEFGVTPSPRSAMEVESSHTQKLLRLFERQQQSIDTLCEELKDSRREVKELVQELREERQERRRQESHPTTGYGLSRGGGNFRGGANFGRGNRRGFRGRGAPAQSGPTPEGNAAEREAAHADAKEQQIVESQFEQVMAKSIGRRPIIKAFFGGVEISCLMDTGSQVTTMTESFYKEKIAPAYPDLLETGRWFRIRAANGLEVPYLGIVTLPVGVKDQTLPDVGILVIKDAVGNQFSESSVPGILGTNVLLHLPGYDNLIPDQERSSKADMAYVRCAEGAVLPALSVSRIEVQIPLQVGDDGPLLVEPFHHPVHGGVHIAPTVISGKGDRSVMVDAVNLSQRPIALKPKRKLATVTPAEMLTPRIQLLAHMGEVHVTKNGKVQEDTEISPSHNKGELPPVDLSKFQGDADQKRRLILFLKKNSDIFLQEGESLGCTPSIQHRIPTDDDIPVTQPYRRIPPPLWKEVQDHLNDLMLKGIIRESISDYASPIVLVRKKGGALRLCIDYRKLNTKVRREVFPLPRIEETLEALSGATSFSTLDLASAYNQVRVAPEDVAKTAFITPMGSFECLRMPFGLSNSPSTWQKLMTRHVFKDDIMHILLVFLDDIIVYARNFDEHLERLQTVFERLRQHGLKLKAEKCSLIQPEVKFLGHVISAGGVMTDPDKVRAVTEWPLPTTLKELRRYLGLTSYLRRFIQGYAGIAGPLHALVGVLGGRKDKKAKKNIPLKSHWTDVHTEAFRALQERLTTAPVLGFADFSIPFILETDASDKGLGAILSQIQQGRRRIIAYASRSLRRGERNPANYSSKKLELLGLKWAVCHKFREYLEHGKFTVLTDNNPLVYLMRTKKLPALEQRWASALASFNFEIVYRPGRSNAGADALSRLDHRPWELPEDEEASSEDEESLSQGPHAADMLAQVANFGSSLPEEIVFATGPAVEDSKMQCFTSSEVKAIPLPSLSQTDISDLQAKDPSISRLKFFYTTGRKPTSAVKSGELWPVQLLLRQWDRLVERNDVLYRQILDTNGNTVYQVLLPEVMKNKVLASAHDSRGHQGVDRTEVVLRQRFYWPMMGKDIRQWVENCARCSLAKKQRIRTPLGTVEASKPLEIIAIDFTLLEKAQGYENVLVITDVFTKFTVAVATRDQKATTVARVLVHYWFHRYGAPLRILSDQGRDFEARLIRELCTMYGVKKCHTTAWHPEGNGQAERFNRTLHDLLKSLPNEQKRRWPEHLNNLVFVYNTTPHSRTGFSPFFLLFGRDARLPLDAMTGQEEPDDEGKELTDWIRGHQQRLRAAYQLVKQRLTRAAAYRKSQHDTRLAGEPLQIGDRVYLRNHPMGRKKIQDEFKPDVFLVINKNAAQDIYQIEPADGLGTGKWVNRRELKLCPRKVILEDNPTHRHAGARVPLNREVNQEQGENFFVLEQPPVARHRDDPPVMPPPELIEPEEHVAIAADREQQALEPARRTPRQNAGYHRNPHHEPRSVNARQGACQVLTASRIETSV